MNKSKLPKKIEQSSIVEKQSTSFECGLETLHAELASVFGDVGEPVIHVDNALPDSLTELKPAHPSARAQPEGMGLGFGGEADIDLYIGHSRTLDKPKIPSLREKYSKELQGYFHLVSIDSYGKGNSEGVVGYHDLPQMMPKGDKTRVNKTRAQMSDDDLKKSEQRAASKLRKKQSCFVL